MSAVVFGVLRQSRARKSARYRVRQVETVDSGWRLNVIGVGGWLFGVRGGDWVLAMGSGRLLWA